MRTLRIMTLGCFLLSVSSAVAAVPARATSKYFLYLFAADDGHMTPHLSHTWGTFVAVTEESGKALQIKPHTISWLPISGVITALALGPERGRNYGLKETFDWAVREKLQMADWGPYEITQELYDLSMKHYDRLNSGEIWYRVLDNENRMFKVLDPASVAAPRAMMCVHAVSDVVYGTDPKGFLLTGRASGFKGTAKVAQHLSDWYVRNTQDPHLLSAIDERIQSAMDEALGVSGYQPRQHLRLESQNNKYCNSLAECRALAGYLELN